MPFLVFRSKIFDINLIATFDFINISCSFFFSFSGTSQLSILHFVFFNKNLTKISQYESKSGFFLSRSHIGRDSGLSSKIGIIATKSG